MPIYQVWDTKEKGLFTVVKFPNELVEDLFLGTRVFLEFSLQKVFLRLVTDQTSNDNSDTEIFTVIKGIGPRLVDLPFLQMENVARVLKLKSEGWV